MEICAHAPARSLLLAAVGLRLVASLAPRASSGSGGGDPLAAVGRGGDGKRHGVEFAPGEVLVQFRAGAAFDGASKSRPQVMRLSAGAGEETEARVERLEGADAVAEGLQAGGKTRADVVRLLVESREVDAREYNGAFVAMQYYGYLRRTPEPGGYQNWLNYLNANPADFRTMVNAFVNSVEYRLRFGS